MELLGYYNYSDKLNYDENRFLKNFEEIHENVVYFNEEKLVLGEKSNKNTNSIEQSIFNFKLESKDAEKYVYSITIIEEGSTFDFMALGKVEIYYQIRDSKIKLKQILVNGVINGPLHDKYNDCFNIRPEDYLHLLINE
jgi:hypothetical protein